MKNFFKDTYVRIEKALAYSLLLSIHFFFFDTSPLGIVLSEFHLSLFGFLTLPSPLILFVRMLYNNFFYLLIVEKLRVEDVNEELII